MRSDLLITVALPVALLLPAVAIHAETGRLGNLRPGESLTIAPSGQVTLQPDSAGRDSTTEETAETAAQTPSSRPARTTADDGTAIPAAGHHPGTLVSSNQKS